MVCHNLGEGGPGVKEGGLFYSQRKKKIFQRFFHELSSILDFFLALNRKKICTVKMMQFLWAKNGYTIEKTMDFFIWVGYPFSCHKGEDLFFTHRGGAGGCISPSPPCPCLTIQPNLKALTNCCLPARGPCWSATPPTSAWPGTPTPWSTCPRTAIPSLKPCATCAGFQGA